MSGSKEGKKKARDAELREFMRGALDVLEAGIDELGPSGAAYELDGMLCQLRMKINFVFEYRRDGRGRRLDSSLTKWIE